jgi:hypothetical protein
MSANRLRAAHGRAATEPILVIAGAYTVLRTAPTMSAWREDPLPQREGVGRLSSVRHRETTIANSFPLA